MTTRNYLRRDGLPCSTQKMRDVLKLPCDAKAADLPFHALEGVHQRTVRALIERDWVAECEGLDGVRYYITGRGLKAWKAYREPNRYRTDGLCPRCNEKPRGMYRTGRQKPYCDNCTRKIRRDAFAEKGWQLKAETLCSRCHKRPRHVYPSGKRITYCAHCRKVLRRAERKRKMKRKLWLVSIGRPPLCLTCKQPVYATKSTVYDYCYTHYRQQQNAYMRRRKGEAT